jgi:RHS repeat-associated protein
LGSTDPQGQPAKRKFDGANRLVERSDALGRTWKYAYDEVGNVSSVLDPLGRTVEYTYDAKWNQPTTFTRFLSDGTRVTARYAYDPVSGSLIRVTDPTGLVETYGYTARGQNSSITMPGNHTNMFTYNSAGDLVSVIDPLGNEGRAVSDGAGRAVSKTDALGYTTTTQYNGASQVTSVTDALGQVTRRNLDPVGRLASVVNPLNNAVESYEYDLENRIARITDALGRSTALAYDAAGRLASTTNRKGGVTSYSYDVQNRLTVVAYADGTSQTRSYDVAGRLTEVREPGDVVKITYDNADRVVRVATENVAGVNEIAYTYDALDRVTSRSVNGSDPTTYTFDLASRPLTMTHRGQTTTYAWSEGRLASRTLPDGIVQSYTYDAPGRVTQIQYTKSDSTVIETVAYTYDGNGNRLKRTSGAASTQETPITATYDAANRMTALTLTATGQTFDLAYDTTGNLISKIDRANSSNATLYTWDSRNRLVGIVAPGVNATFTYDSLGRRVGRTVNGESGAFVYEGRQVIGELRNGMVSTSILTGLAIDDVIARNTSAGARTYLTDALASVIALARDDQSIQNYYSYSPYGEVAVMGDDEGNSIQYTGRENDRTGLYFYRARYYDPILKRFISEDPIGLAGGGNVYSYVDGNPVGANDPTGLKLRAWWIQRPTPSYDGWDIVGATPIDLDIKGPGNLIFYYVMVQIRARVDFTVGCEETDECGTVDTWTTSASLPLSTIINVPVKINLIATFFGPRAGLAGLLAWVIVQAAIYVPEAVEFYNANKALLLAAYTLAETLAGQDPTMFCF